MNTKRENIVKIMCNDNGTLHAKSWRRLRTKSSTNGLLCSRDFNLTSDMIKKITEIPNKDTNLNPVELSIKVSYSLLFKFQFISEIPHSSLKMKMLNLW